MQCSHSQCGALRLSSPSVGKRRGGSDHQLGLAGRQSSPDAELGYPGLEQKKTDDFATSNDGFAIGVVRRGPAKPPEEDASLGFQAHLPELVRGLRNPPNATKSGYMQLYYLN